MVGYGPERDADYAGTPIGDRYLVPVRFFRFRVTFVLGVFALAATLGADPAPSTKLVPTMVRADPQNVTITTAPLSVNAPLNRLPLPISITGRGIGPANPIALGGTLATAPLTAVAPGGTFTTISLSAYAPGGTFPMVVAPLSAGAPVPSGGTVVTTGLNATAPGGSLATVPLGTIATVSLSASAPGGSFTIGVAPLSALGPPPAGGIVPTQSLTANAPSTTPTPAPR